MTNQPTCQCRCHDNGGFGCEYCSTFHNISRTAVTTPTAPKPAPAKSPEPIIPTGMALNADNMLAPIEPRPPIAQPTVSKLGVEAPAKPRKRKRKAQMYAPFKRTTPFGVTPGKYERVTMVDGTPYPALTKQRAIHRYQDLLLAGQASDLRVVKEAK